MKKVKSIESLIFLLKVLGYVNEQEGIKEGLKEFFDLFILLSICCKNAPNEKTYHQSIEPCLEKQNEKLREHAYYFGARYLDPQTSRWMSPDPIYSGLKEGFSIYGYCRNNPLIYHDPTGLEEITYYDGRDLRTKDVKFSDMTAKQQMVVLKSKVQKGMSVEGNDRGAAAAELRGLRGDMNLKGLFKEDETFMNETLRDFMNIKEDGTMNYTLDELTQQNGWAEYNSLTSQYHQTRAGEFLNAKFVNEDGREVIINVNGEVVTDIMDKGTYNYVNGSTSFSQHKKWDMDPYDRQMDRLGLEPNLRYYPPTWNNPKAPLQPNRAQWPNQ